MTFTRAQDARGFTIPLEQSVTIGTYPKGTRVGCDVVAHDRIQHALARNSESFAELLFTPNERGEISASIGASPEARFAAKEAVLKALSHGLSGGLSLLQISTEADGIGLAATAAKLAGPVRVERAFTTTTNHVVACVWLVPKLPGNQ